MAESFYYNGPQPDARRRRQLHGRNYFATFTPFADSIHYPIQLGWDSQLRMVYLTRKAEFSASHYYHNPEFSADENKRIFGKCNNPHGHGHNYTLEVTVKGHVDQRSGFVVDLKDLKEIMNREVIEALDHRFLNKEVPEFHKLIPTTENLAVTIWERLRPRLTLAQLHRIRVYETPDLFVDYYGEA